MAEKIKTLETTCLMYVIKHKLHSENLPSLLKFQIKKHYNNKAIEFQKKKYFYAKRKFLNSLH